MHLDHVVVRGVDSHLGRVFKYRAVCTLNLEGRRRAKNREVACTCDRIDYFCNRHHRGGAVRTKNGVPRHRKIAGPECDGLPGRERRPLVAEDRELLPARVERDDIRHDVHVVDDEANGTQFQRLLDDDPRVPLNQRRVLFHYVGLPREGDLRILLERRRLVARQREPVAAKVDRSDRKIDAELHVPHQAWDLTYRDHGHRVFAVAGVPSLNRDRVGTVLRTELKCYGGVRRSIAPDFARIGAVGER